jgi:glycosyltransferase involved in cell wall biosynthesis
VSEGGLARPSGEALRFSVVIPAWNEERLLPLLLDSLAEARRRYTGGGQAIEVIVADNASTDATAAIAAQGGAVVTPVPRRSIAAARNGGAALARGEVLCFLDADSRAHPELFNAMGAALSDPEVGLGASGIRYERTSPGIRFVMALATPLLRMMGLDLGAVFVRRADLEAVGGFDESLLAFEDLDLMLRVKRRCRTRGQRFRRLAGVETITSARKFDRHGDWHFLAMGAALAWKMLFHRRAYERDARRYWYEDH